MKMIHYEDEIDGDEVDFKDAYQDNFDDTKKDDLNK